MLTENDITELLIKYLRDQGYTNTNHLTTLQKGVDITAVNPDGINVWIEVKGETSAKETSKRFGKPFTGNQIWTHVSVALLKTLTLMNEDRYKGCEFGMAFPINHESLLSKVKLSTDSLGIRIYLVSKEEIRIL